MPAQIQLKPVKVVEIEPEIDVPGTLAMPSGTRSVVMPAMFWQKSNTKVPGDDSHMSHGVYDCAIRIGGRIACDVILTSGLGPPIADA